MTTTPVRPAQQSGRRFGHLTNVEVRTSADGSLRVKGHAAVFNTPAQIGPPGLGFEERIAPGAFKRTINNGADVRFLFNHNPDLVLARTKAGSLTLREDKIGLAIEANLARTSIGQDLAILLGEKIVDQMSFGFQVVKDQWETKKRDDDTEYEIRTILEAKLFDVSAVTYPAYDETDLALREAQLAKELRDTPKTPDPVDPAPATPPEPEPAPNRDPVPDGVVSSPQSDPAPATPVQDEPQETATEKRSTSVSTTLYDERARIWHKMKELLAETEGRTMSSEEEHSWQNMESDMERVGRSIAIHEKGSQYAGALEAPADGAVSTRGSDNAAHPATPFNPASTPTGRAVAATNVPGDIQRAYDYERAFSEYLRRGMDEMGPEHRQLLQREYRAQSVGTNTAGGYLVPPGFVQKITEAMKAYGGMLQASNVIDTDSGQPLQWPTNDDTSNVGAILGENTQATELAVTLGTRTLGAFMYTSRLVLVSFQLLQDSAFSLDDFLARRFAERIGRAINAHFTNGTGGGTQPSGLVPGLTIITTGAVGTATSFGAGGATNVAYQNLVDIEHSIDPAYRANAAWMMADTSIKGARKILDSTGQPIWQPGMQQGVPSTLNGYPVIINQDMPAMAANAKSVAFGDFRQAYVIRRTSNVATLRLTERYADFLQVGYLAYARYDGVVDDTKAAAIFQNSAT